MESPISPFHLLGSDTWYTSPEILLGSRDAHRLVHTDLPEGWRRQAEGIWVHLSYDGARLPAQGWKIHVSCTTDDYERTVGAAWEVCRGLRLPWKFIGHPRLHQWCNGKGADRGFSGKAIAVYPDGEASLRGALEELAERLSGVNGPYILSDLRWKDTTAYVRYGAFAEMWCRDKDGRSVPGLRGPDGRLEPDVRGPVFTPPAWLAVPEWLAEGTGYAERSIQSKSKRPTLHGYTVKRALHFSNAGGVYVAEDPGGRSVVLKEARPHSGIDAAGRDAVARLRHEHGILLALSGRPWAPEVYEYFEEWEHHYLAIEYFEGSSMQRVASRELPFIRPDASEQEFHEYRSKVHPLLLDLEQVLTELHELGYAFGDLHTQNIIVDPDETGVRLIDFESAKRLDSTREAGLHTPGFAPGRPMSPEEADWYSYASCQLAMFAPYNYLSHLSPTALVEGVAILEERFRFPPSELAVIRSRLGIEQPDAHAGVRHPESEHASLAAGILESADPLDEHRLYSADPDGLGPAGAVGLASGASGVIFALEAAGMRVPEDHLAWLRRAVRSAPADTGLGLYTGLAGAALVMHRLGDPSAPELLDRLAKAPMPDALDLATGRTGVAQLLLEVGESDHAVRLAESIHKDLERGDRPTAPGLLLGHSGISMLFAALARFTEDGVWIDRYLEMIDEEVAGAEIEDRELLLWYGKKLVPYLGRGSAGLALAMLSGYDWLTERHLVLLAKCLRAMEVEFMVEAGLFRGRLGIAYSFAQAGRFLPEFAEKARNVRARLHPYIGTTATGRTEALIGRESHRLSLDLATGSAGLVFVDSTLAEPETRQLPGMEVAART